MPMQPDTYIRSLAAALTRQEDATTREARTILFELALRVRALLLANLPEQGISRSLVWPRIRAYIAPLVETASRRISGLIASALLAAEPQVTTIAQRLFELPPNTLTPRTLAQIANDTRVLTQRLTDLFTPIPPTNTSPFTQQLLRLLDRTVVGALLRDEPTSTIAASIYAVPTLRRPRLPRIPSPQRLLGGLIGFPSPTAPTAPTAAAAAPQTVGALAASKQRGTVANAWLGRTTAITAAALWGLVTPTLITASTAATAPTVATVTTATAPRGLRGWIWNAILDPRTCPVCYPLDGVTAPTPLDFPQGPPPLHPRCRCVLVPDFL